MRVSVLGVLYEKHHQEGDNRSRCVHDELPGVGVVKEGSSYGPHDDQQDGREERQPGTRNLCASCRKSLKNIFR